MYYSKLFVGAMGAGKTSSLLREVRDMGSNFGDIYTLKSILDLREPVNKIVTRDPTNSLELVVEGRVHNLRDFKDPNDYEPGTLVVLDELHLFADAVQFIADLLDNGCHFVAAGIKFDAFKHPFAYVE